MDMSLWSLAGGLAIVGLLLLRGMLLFAKKPNSRRMSPRLQRIAELRRKVEEKAAQQEAGRRQAEPATDPGASSAAEERRDP